jgi:uncharacterized protein YgbK (DUF1537 family)
VLTNSRRCPLEKAAATSRETACDLALVACARGVEPVVMSRSDSTLRGHYPGEVSALYPTLEPELKIRCDDLVIVPFFLEEGRLTIKDIQWVEDGECLRPAAPTEFARDPTFGYRHSNRGEWVAGKTGECRPRPH